MCKIHNNFFGQGQLPKLVRQTRDDMGKLVCPGSHARSGAVLTQPVPMSQLNPLSPCTGSLLMVRYKLTSHSY